MRDDGSTLSGGKTTQKSPCGAEKRRRRVAKGLDPYSPSERAYEARRARKRAKAQYDQRRIFFDEIKLQSGCVDCGYREHPVALQFDHLPGHEKKYTIAQMTNNIRMELVLAELAKCEVVCANCHAVRTLGRRRKGA